VLLQWEGMPETEATWEDVAYKSITLILTLRKMFDSLEEEL